ADRGPRHARAARGGAGPPARPAPGARRAARRTARGRAAAAGAGAGAGGDRRDHRRRPGNREVTAALCDGQAAGGAGSGRAGRRGPGRRVVTRPTDPTRNDALQPDERALARELERAAPAGGPPPALDAAILAAARDAAA